MSGVSIDSSYQVAEPAEWAGQDKGARRQHVSTSETIYGGGDSVGDAEGYDGG